MKESQRGTNEGPQFDSNDLHTVEAFDDWEDEMQKSQNTYSGDAVYDIPGPKTTSIVLLGES